MDLRIERTELEGGTNYSWLRSTHGVGNARPGTLDGTAFANTLVLSGTPVQKSGEKYVPYSTGKLAGFVVEPVKVTDGDAAFALLWHGEIVTANVPIEGFTAPADAGLFEYV